MLKMVLKKHLTCTIFALRGSRGGREGGPHEKPGHIVAGLEKTVAEIRISRGVGAADTADGDDVAGVAAGVGVESLDEFRELGIDRVGSALDSLYGVLERDNVNVIAVCGAGFRVWSDVLAWSGAALCKGCLCYVALDPVKEIVGVEIDHVDRVARCAFNGIP